jgi:methionine aminopeptidase
LLLEEIKRYKGLPFSEVWIGNGLNEFSRKFALRELLKSEAIASYPVLIDKKGCFVSQAETSFIITEEGLIDLVRVDEL